MSSSEPAQSGPAGNAPAEQGNLLTARRFFGILLGYFGLQLVLRVAISPSVDLDESEQIILTQKLSWGYGPQPPLYTWLQYALFNVFGTSIFALALLKNALLFCLYLFTYLNARLITRNPLCGMAAAASLAFIPQIVWESQRDLTHSVLASLLSAATVFVVLRLRDRQTISGYVWLGVCAGLGVLSKYNYAILFTGLFLAAVSRRGFRSVFFDKRVLLSLGILILIVAPNGYWIWTHQELAFRSAVEFHIEETRVWFSSVMAGLASLLISTVTFIGPLALVYGVVFWKTRNSRPNENSEAARWLGRTLVIIYSLIVLSVLGFEVTEIRDRWLQPILVSVPVIVVALLQHRLSAVRLRYLLIAGAFILLIVSLLIPGRILLAEKFERTEPLSKPYREIARQLEPELAEHSVIVTDAHVLAGNLRLNLPGKTFLAPTVAELFAARGRPKVLVWDATPSTRRKRRPAGEPPIIPQKLRDYAAKAGLGELDESRVRYLSATFYFHKARPMKVGFLVLNPPSN